MIMLENDTYILKKKFFILLFGVVIYFFTCMSKALVPGPIFNNMLDLGLKLSEISTIGASFMLTYSASQLLAGIFADRYGGVRILLIGGSLFAVGMICFPCSTNFLPLFLSRAIAGFGAGMVFLGIAKLIADVFPEKISLALGIILFLAFFGPVCGTYPMVKLIELTNWRTGMFIPAAISSAALLGVAVLARGTIKPAVPGNALAPLFEMLKNRQMWLLCASSSISFGCYYVLLNQLGQKSIQDFCHFPPERAALCIMSMTILVAVGNMGVNLLLKLCGNRRRIIIRLSALCTLAGAILGYCSFRWNFDAASLLISFLLIAAPGGFFPLFGTVAKELNPPKSVGLSIAILNFSATAFIALMQYIGGLILKTYETTMTGNRIATAAYYNIFFFLIIAAAIGFALIIPVVETKNKNRT